MLSQVDIEGHHYKILYEICDHSSDGTDIKRKYRFIKYKNGNLHCKKITCGWKLPVEWKDRYTYWAKLNDLNASNPLELYEYFKSNKIHNGPEFKWLINDTIKRQDQKIQY